MAALSSSNSSDYLSGIQKTVLTSSPTVTLLVTRIPFSLTEEGLLNLLSKCGDVTVLNCKLVVNKGGFAGIRGLNYAYVTLAKDEAVVVIEKLNCSQIWVLLINHQRKKRQR